jgi:hypothetical protein
MIVGWWRSRSFATQLSQEWIVAPGQYSFLCSDWGCLRLLAGRLLNMVCRWREKVCDVLAVLVFALLGTLSAAGQTCPDRKAKVACQSFHELLSSKDENLLMRSRSDSALACFRESDDQFFTVTWDWPGVQRWEIKMRTPTGEPEDVLLVSVDRDLREGYTEVDQDAYQFGTVMIESYKNGIYEGGESFSGLWQTSVNEGKAEPWSIMTSEHDKLGAADRDRRRSIRVDRVGIAASSAFANAKNGTTQHTITIQLSTGRFSEEFEAGESKNVYSGRCASFKSLPKRPSPRAKPK